ncbi:oxygenase MpaB family protein [Kitasatospora sp. NPDC058965]|uniref:oxygenase MpaB family protein n=1 Tax=Kitasatospora sp. NPDC058965 TaxID=3346682 RepID=UPI003695ABB6
MDGGQDTPGTPRAPKPPGLPGPPCGLRERLGAALFARVAGPDGRAVRERIHHTPGERWFPPGRAIRTVHGDASMFVGGLTALLVQSLHPSAMAAVAAYSGYRSDPWGRLQRTSTFLAVTSFGTADDARAAVARVRAVHARIRGTTADGRRYRADDPHLLAWVHAAEADSFLRAHQAYGATPLDPAGCDAYVADMARVAAALGVQDPPRDRAGLDAALRSYRPELAVTPEAEAAAAFLLRHPPVPLAARPLYGALAAAAVELMAPEHRTLLGLPGGPLVTAAVRPLGLAVVRTIRWAMPAPGERR